MSKLLIVESPTKARTIGKMLGKDYTIIASMGHIRDLPERELGVDIAHNFAPQYVDTARSKTVVRELRAAAKKADEIYLAPDPDREGEAIAWHLAAVLEKSTTSPLYRVSFHEITRSAIERALGEKGTINLNLVDAQQARRVLDRIVGYQVSPLLWSRIEKGSSAGRVQSVALRLVVERERAIEAFQTEEYWVFSLVFRTEDGREFTARLFKIDGKDFRVAAGPEARALIETVKGGAAPAVGQLATSERRRNAPPPFTTSTLQQTANTVLHYSATSTMRYAQQLYEGIDIGKGGSAGLITYMRTDSVTIAREAQEAARNFIRESYGEKYLPEKPNFFRNKGSAQEAHEAIRPTDVRRLPEAMAPFLDAQQLKLYSLIWQRFVASQMAPARQNLTTADVEIQGKDSHHYLFRATATVTVFEGFGKVYEESKKNRDESRKAQTGLDAAGNSSNLSKKNRDESREAEVLGSLKVGDPLSIRDLGAEQKFTDPPPRYSEAALIKELEENGIGRPSTYATILRTIQDRSYVTREQGKLVPTRLGFNVNDFLVERLPELFDVGFTAKMEQELDEIEEGKVRWTDMMADFYAKFAPWLEAAKQSGAPPSEEVEALLKLLSNVKFEAPEKVGRRTYDDGRFFHSLHDQFAKEGTVTEKQFRALLSLAAKYRAGIGEKAAFLPPRLQAALSAAAEEHARREERRDQSLAATAAIDYEGLFAAFDNVTFEPPAKKGRFTYDDKKFVLSLKRQALDGRGLSEKQTAALRRMAAKYRGELANPDLVGSILEATAPIAAENAGNSDAPVAPAVQDPRVAPLLEQLSHITKWAKPVRRGRVTYDDREFYKSIAKQAASGRVLSARQVAALVKMAGKYPTNDEDTEK